MNMKKLFSLIMALLMAFSMVAVAEEVDEEDKTVALATRALTGYTITIQNAVLNAKDGSVVPRTFEAYQIFQGTLDAEGNLGVTGWGTGVNGTDLLTALKASGDIGADFGEDVDTAAEVAKIVADHGTNETWLNNFAKVVAAHVTANGKDSYTMEELAKIDDLPVGYYLVEETTKFADGQMPDDFVYSRYMLKLTSDITIAPKINVPELDKKIDGNKDEDEDTNGLVEASNGNIGDTVSYVLTAPIPDMTYYTSYNFRVVDTLSAGLTYANNLKVTVAGAEKTVDTDYTVVVNGQTITIEFTDFIQYKGTAGNVVITYDATINENAVIGNGGNENTARLEYSNNPNNPESWGQTPDEVVETYVTSIALEKFAMVEGVKTELAGAVFTIKGVSTTVVRVKDSEGNITTKTVTNEVSEEITVDENGYLNFYGLGEGTYTITEVKAPAGYNLLVDPIVITITCAYPEEVADATATCTWSATSDDVTITDANGVFSFEVENKKGSQLPSTGGMGTTMLYVGGGILMMAAFVLIVSKRRATAE